MGFWFYRTGLYYPSGTYGMVFMTDTGEDPLKRPDDSIITARDGPNYGSGPYYKQVSRAYLEDGNYSAAGMVNRGESIAFFKQSDWRGFCGRSVDISSTKIVQYQGLRNTGNHTSGQGSVSVLQIVHDGAYYYSCRSTASWTQTDGYYPPTNKGCFGCLCESSDDILQAAMWVVSYVGEDPGLLLNPYYVGYKRKTYWTVDETARANVSYTVDVERLDSRWNYRSDNIHAYWRYDEVDNRLFEWRTITEFGIIPGRIRNTVSTALANTMASLPEVSANSIMNILQLSSGLRNTWKVGMQGIHGILQSLAAGIKQGVDPRDAWLSWRYVYKTTKMDIEDYADVTNRLLGLARSSGTTFKVHGSASGNGFTIRCVKQYLCSDFDPTFYDAQDYLRAYGMRLSAYNMWDMVPYSFMVDWFTDIGPRIELAQNWNRHYDLKAEDTWYSYYEQLEHGFIYYRWHGTDPSIPPSYVKHETSKRTIAFRLADTISIFT